MPLLNFQRQFVDPIRRGVKAHTIRADRKIPIKPGDLLYLYCGARTKSCFRILEQPVTCTKVEIILILGPREIITGVLRAGEDASTGHRLDQDEAERLAVADGFPDLTRMMAFWDGRLPFKGQIIHWPPVVTFNEFS